MKGIAFLILPYLSPFFLFAQKGNTDQKEAIRKLHWMVGNWVGTSTVDINGQKQITNIRESIEATLDGTILLINVAATDKDSNTSRQSVVYTAFSVISYDLKGNKYRWTTWRNSGNAYDQHDFSVGANSFEYVTDQDSGKVRYKANLGEEGEFLETGEFSKDGSAWTQFITMKLVKIRR